LQAFITFAFYFMNSKMEDYESLYLHLKNDQDNLKRLVNIKQSLARENVNHELLYDTVINYLPICLKFFDNFESSMKKQDSVNEFEAMLKSINDPLEKDILKTFDVFNRSIEKTNFYNP